ncbi:DUF4179 domain-containing protein [Clostridium gasigenes]|uniref:DUF4179 domain-containing protein n=1 Tax=Clostridium gasigenes TaxID=94869 RepID=UPI001C0D0FAD|nr:DUF4179 domain-containing protein [Clostridium gasigenes]MBU3106187.1 DUF4179 domain-containing protein [Clostridium gasigenes]
MSNKQFSDIEIPENIDLIINNGIERADKEIKLKKSNKRKSNITITAASILFFFILGFANPALAAKIPIVGSVFDNIEKNIYFPGNYSEYATAVNETVSNNGISITLSDILCDGEGLYVTYVVESEEPFKYTSWGDGPLTRNQLLTREAYNNVSFSKDELDNSGIAGLEGKFIDDNTFIGMERYYLKSLNTEVPDNFDFQTKLTSVRTKALDDSEKNQTFNGTWAFKVPVKVDKAISKNIDIDYTQAGFYLDSMSITPFRITINSRNPGTTLYFVRVFDDKNNQLKIEGSSGFDENKQISYFESMNKDSKSLRIEIYHDILEKGEITYNEDGSTNTDYKKAGQEILLEKTINLE